MDKQLLDACKEGNVEEVQKLELEILYPLLFLLLHMVQLHIMILLINRDKVSFVLIRFIFLNRFIFHFFLYQISDSIVEMILHF